jgi:hypothetical protein
MRFEGKGASGSLPNAAKGRLVCMGRDAALKRRSFTVVPGFTVAKGTMLVRQVYAFAVRVELVGACLRDDGIFGRKTIDGAGISFETRGT